MCQPGDLNGNKNITEVNSQLVFPCYQGLGIFLYCTKWPFGFLFNKWKMDADCLPTITLIILIDSNTNKAGLEFNIICRAILSHPTVSMKKFCQPSWYQIYDLAFRINGPYSCSSNGYQGQYILYFWHTVSQHERFSLHQ